MNKVISLCNLADGIFKKLLAPVDFTGALLLRIFLAPIFILAGYGKLRLGDETASLFEKLLPDPNVASWFGEYLGMPFPNFMAFMAGWTELLGGILLLIGLLTRYISIPLMFTMIVAATAVHWEYGWHTLPEKKLLMPWEWRKDMIVEADKRKARAVEILKEHSNYEWITEYGSITILKNGIENAAIYFIMLMVLLFSGGGRFVSIDYWLARKFSQT